MDPKFTKRTVGHGTGLLNMKCTIGAIYKTLL
jgi:hypothetical protein